MSFAFFPQALDPLVVSWPSIVLVANTVKSLNPAGGSVLRPSNVIAWNATTGAWTFPAANASGGPQIGYCFRWNVGYVQPANHGWHFQNIFSFSDSTNVSYTDALPAADASGGDKTLEGICQAADLVSGNVLQLVCDVGNTIGLIATFVRLSLS